MKYIQDFSNCFENEEVILEGFHEGDRVIYSKADHLLDGQTYILKKQHIWVSQNQDIQDHPAYRQILDIKDNGLSDNVRYYNSWVELEKGTRNTGYSNPTSGLGVVLVIQLRNEGETFELPEDLIPSPTTNTKENIHHDIIGDRVGEGDDEGLELTKNGIDIEAAMTHSPQILTPKL